MQCPRCKFGGQLGTYCSHCGNQLKEKCSECGEWEPIEIGVCLKSANEINKEMKTYVENVTKKQKLLEDWSLYAEIIIFLLIFASGVFALSKGIIPTIFGLSEGESFIILFLFFAAVFAVIWIGFVMKFFSNKFEFAKNKAKQKFLQANPEKAEILKKAGIVVDKSHIK